MIRQLKDMWGCKAKLFHIYVFRVEVIFESWFRHFGNHWYYFYWFYCFSLAIKLYMCLFSRTCLSQRFSSFFENPMELRGGASIFPPKIAFVCFQLFLHSSGLFGGDAERESIRYKVNSENTICCFFFCLEGLGDSFVSYYRFHSRTFIIMVKMKRTMSVCHIPWIIARPLYVTARKNVYRRWGKKDQPKGSTRACTLFYRQSCSFWFNYTSVAVQGLIMSDFRHRSIDFERRCK